jgi:8-oxo-dGTP diphosphatase
MQTVPIAKALVLDADGNMLMLRRSSIHPTLALHRDLPGGLIDPGEEPGQAVIREIKEETGLTVNFDEVRLTYTGTEAHGDESRVRLLYIVHLKSVKPEVQISWEHDQAEWLPLDELEMIEDDFRTFYHEALEYVRKHKLVA